MKKDFFSSQFNLTTVFFGTTAFFMTVAGMMVLDLVNLPAESEQKKINSSPLISQVSANNDWGNGGPCFDGWSSWPKSTKLKTDAIWSTAFMWGDHGDSNVSTEPLVINNTQHLNPSKDLMALYNYFFINNFDRDLNGDGLPDYAYIKRGQYNSDMYKMKDCVYLSNGQGWSPVYRCVHSWNYYYGDCADTSV